MQNGKIEYFAILRGVAIIAIIFTHIHQIFDLPMYMRIIPRFGQMGCQIFFLISGFFAYNPSYIYRERGMINPVMEYYKKRMKRIAPGYWLTILLGIAVCLLTIFITGENNTRISIKPIDIVINMLLINGLVPTSAMNNVVRGGWFVGTLVVLYFITPFLSRFFYRIKSKKLFPLKVFIISTFIFIIGSLIDERLACKNNSAFYFSFLNQISCFLLGFSLKELYEKKELKFIKNPIPKGILFLFITFCLFTIGYWQFNYIIYPIVPFCMATAVFYFSCYFLKNNNCYSDCFLKKIFIKFGELDYAIMLIHPFVVFDLGQLTLRYLTIPHTTLFFVMIPILYIVIFFIAKIYSKIIVTFSGLILK